MASVLGQIYNMLFQNVRSGAATADNSGQIPQHIEIGPGGLIHRELPGPLTNAGYIPFPYEHMGMVIAPDQRVPMVTRAMQDRLSNVISRVSLHRITGF